MSPSTKEQLHCSARPSPGWSATVRPGGSCTNTAGSVSPTPLPPRISTRPPPASRRPRRPPMTSASARTSSRERPRAGNRGAWSDGSAVSAAASHDDADCPWRAQILWSRLPAAKGGQHLVEVIWPLQDVPRFGTFAWSDDTPAFQQVHEPARLRETHPELALQHGRRAELAGDDQLGRGDQQLEVVADLAVDFPGLLRRGGDVRPVLDLLLLLAVLDDVPDLLLGDERVL